MVSRVGLEPTGTSQQVNHLEARVRVLCPSPDCSPEAEGFRGRGNARRMEEVERPASRVERERPEVEQSAEARSCRRMATRGVSIMVRWGFFTLSTGSERVFRPNASAPRLHSPSAPERSKKQPYNS